MNWNLSCKYSAFPSYRFSIRCHRYVSMETVKGTADEITGCCTAFEIIAVSSVSLGHWTVWWQMSWHVKSMVCSAFSLSSGHSPTLLTRSHSRSRELYRVWVFITTSIKMKDSTTHLMASRGAILPAPSCQDFYLDGSRRVIPTLDSKFEFWDYLELLRFQSLSSNRNPGTYVFSQPSKHTILPFLFQFRNAGPVVNSSRQKPRSQTYSFGLPKQPVWDFFYPQPSKGVSSPSLS